MSFMGVTMFDLFLVLCAFVFIIFVVLISFVIRDGYQSCQTGKVGSDMNNILQIFGMIKLNGTCL